MKPIEVMIDERLLEELDATEEAKREGRSAVMQRALAQYLRRRRRRTIREQYERAYGASGGADAEHLGFVGEGVWPD